MPKYYFNISDGQDFPDLEGTELPDHETARHEAVRMASSLLAEKGKAFWNAEIWRMEVRDTAGLLIFLLVFVATDGSAAQGVDAEASADAVLH